MVVDMSLPYNWREVSWTWEEDQILFHHYKHGTKKCMHMLGDLNKSHKLAGREGYPTRTANAIIGRAHRLHLTTTKGERWKNYRRPVVE